METHPHATRTRYRRMAAAASSLVVAATVLLGPSAVAGPVGNCDQATYLGAVMGNGGTDKGSTMGATVYDGGGWLENTGGPQIVQHNKSKPDAVLSHEQWETMRRIAENTAAGMTYAPTYQFMGEDPETVMRRDKARAMDLFNALTPA